MKLLVQQKSEVPIYEQLYTQIVTQILSEQVKADECLPSIRFVAKELQISVIPVKAAYEKLESDGYIYTVPGKGCFVKDMGRQIREKKLRLVEEQVATVVQLSRSLGLGEQEIVELIKKYFA